ncbi:MAG: tetraacyldisaccharide 4'-kinase [Gelidibacter sp.]|nr:tetraacyldisaccharide 4'-kinase [Gelidibacter sp.]
MKLLRYILFPVVPIYFLVIWLRNKLYDFGLKSSVRYDLPIICVGNLSVGGTGKTPMIEYLIRFLQTDYKIATLSRGYKRSTKGFVIADKNATALSVGDEPFQFYQKFKNVIVSVDADRRNGIRQLLKLHPKPTLILLDDAFQHRKVKAGFNILLTAFDNLFTDDLLLPTGNLREPKSGAKRAHCIVVTKCPDTITANEKAKIVNKIQPLPHQKVFFSSIDYSNTINNGLKDFELDMLKGAKFTLVTGIANATPLVRYLKSQNLEFDHLNFKDHYEFTESDIKELKSKSAILTTEKDFVRLQPHFKNAENLYYLPIKIKVDDASDFENLIENYLK